LWLWAENPLNVRHCGEIKGGCVGVRPADGSTSTAGHLQDPRYHHRSSNCVLGKTSAIWIVRCEKWYHETNWLRVPISLMLDCFMVSIHIIDGREFEPMPAGRQILRVGMIRWIWRFEEVLPSNTHIYTLRVFMSFLFFGFCFFSHPMGVQVTFSLIFLFNLLSLLSSSRQKEFMNKKNRNSRPLGI